MATLEEVKSSLFKVKKVSYYTNYNRDSKSEKIGVVIPYYDNYRSSFDNSKITVIGLDGEVLNISVNNCDIKTTRIMDSKERELVDKVVEYGKNLTTSRSEKVKLLESLKKKELMLNNKIKKDTDGLTKSLDRLKKYKGYLPLSDIQKYFKKYFGSDLYRNYNDNYKCCLGDYSAEICIVGTKLKELNFTKEIEVGRWLNENSFDFLYEEYDGSLHTKYPLDKSKDFEKLKRHYFKSLSTSVSNKLKASESYFAETGDKNSLDICHNICIVYDADFTRDTLKKLIKDIKTLQKEMG